MPDSRFKTNNGFCRLCHKYCFESELEAIVFMADNPQRELTYTYECPLYPSGYWHVTSAKNVYPRRYWKIQVLKLGPVRSRKIFDRIQGILDRPLED